MELVKKDGTTVDIVVLSNDIQDIIEQYTTNSLDKDNPSMITQGQFNSCLMECYKRCIYPLELFNNTKDKPHNYKEDDTLIELCNIYINVCNKYDKHICLTGFGFLTGISIFTLMEWRDKREVSQVKQNISKIIDKYDEETLQDLLITGKRNPVGIVAVLNNKHGWASQTIKRETVQRIETNENLALALGVDLDESQ